MHSYDVETKNLRASNSRNKDSQSESAKVLNADQFKTNRSEKDRESSMAPDVKEKKGQQRRNKSRNVPENADEDLVVLSFSSSTG